MPEMASAAAADDLDAAHPLAVVLMRLDAVGVHRVEEARPSRAGVELGAGVEQLLSACGAAIDAALLRVHILARERRLGSRLSQHVVLLGAQLGLPLLLALGDLLHRRSSLWACMRLATRYSESVWAPAPGLGRGR